MVSGCARRKWLQSRQETPKASSPTPPESCPRLLFRRTTRSDLAAWRPRAFSLRFEGLFGQQRCDPKGLLRECSSSCPLEIYIGFKITSKYTRICHLKLVSERSISSLDFSLQLQAFPFFEGNGLQLTSFISNVCNINDSTEKRKHIFNIRIVRDFVGEFNLLLIFYGTRTLLFLLFGK